MGLVKSVLQRLARTEFGELGRLDLNGGARSGVAPSASGTLRNGKGAKANQGDRAAFFEGGSDARHHGFEGAACRGLRDICVLGDVLDEIGLIQFGILGVIRSEGVQPCETEEHVGIIKLFTNGAVKSNIPSEVLCGKASEAALS